MAEILGLGCSHGTIILTPPQAWAKGRERIFARVPNYQSPPQLLRELGEDNGLSQDIVDQQHVVDAFAVLRERLHTWEPDVLLIIGDDQAENFQRSAKKLMQHRTDGGYDRRQIHPRVGGDDHGIPLA